jgi:hypothetical protein
MDALLKDFPAAVHERIGGAQRGEVRGSMATRSMSGSCGLLVACLAGPDEWAAHRDRRHPSSGEQVVGLRAEHRRESVPAAELPVDERKVLLHRPLADAELACD